MITNIQLLRAFAAFAVVMYHTSFSYRTGIHTEFQGVSIFFVISGFIMTHISRSDDRNFFYHRCLRIIPIYFFVTLAVFFAKLKVLLPYEIFHYLIIDGHSGTGLTLTNLVKSLFFIPYKNPSGNWHPINAVGWTLNLEMYFYVIYSVALLISKRLAPAIVIFTIVLINLLGRQCVDSLCAFYAQNYTYYFVLGIVAYYIWQQITPRLATNRLSLYWTSTFFLIFFFTWHLSPEFVGAITPSLYSAISYLLPPLMLLVALCLHSVGARCNLKLLLILGESSYALYLTHTVVIGQYRSMGYRIDENSDLGTVAAVVLASTLIAIALHFFFERPITQRLRSARPK